MRRLIILLTLLLTLSGCKPVILSLSASPMNFCSLPQRITVSWSAQGETFRLSASPAASGLASEIVASNGSRDVTVNADSTNFTLTASKGPDSTSQTVRVARTRGAQSYALGGHADCVGGRLVRTVEVSEAESSRGRVVRTIGNRGTGILTITGPGGRTTNIPALESSDDLSGTPLVGTWTMWQTTTPSCSPTAGGGLIGVEAVVVCE
jgi:hypothetical protein